MDPSCLPEDILILILEFLGVNDLMALSLSCRSMHTIVVTFGWPGYLRTHPRPSYSLAKARSFWSPRIRVLYDTWSDSAWDRSEFIARPLSRTWKGKLQPVLAISPSRLIVGAGDNLYSYAFNASHNTTSPSVNFEGVVSLLRPADRGRNITALTFIDDGGFNRTLHVAFQDGVIERVVLSRVTPDVGQLGTLSVTQNNLDAMHNGDFIESLSPEANYMLALSTTGHVKLGDHRPEYTDADSSIIELNVRSWVSHLCLQSSTPYAAFGTASSTPLNVHSITDGQLSPRPFAVLHTSNGVDSASDRPQFSAVYGLSRGPLNSPWGSSPQILVSGWFDGHVRCHDLRSSSRSYLGPISGKSSIPAPLRPVLSLADRWSYEPIYSVSCGGGSASYVAAGTGRHSLVSFWDVRSPKDGWSVHAPGNDPSPVYSVVLESSRFFGVTQSRPFVYDFGPGVTMDTYPPIAPVRGIDKLKQKKGSNRATYSVLRYTHKGSGLGSEH